MPRAGRMIRLYGVAAAAIALCAGVAAAGTAPSAAATPAADEPPIVRKLIPFGPTRQSQTAAYSQRHYHQDTCRLSQPKTVVLHYTAGGEWRSAWWTFANNTTYNGEKPGVSAHFIVCKDGTIIQCVRLSLRARHAIGMNWKSIGIEFVQEVPSGKNGHWADLQILARKAQIRTGLRLVRSLQVRYGIANKNVIGHAMANGSPYFKDYTGAKNGASDWIAKDVRAFRARL
jgi:hypothetical protein